MGSLSSRLLRRRGGLSLGDGAAGEGGRGGGGGGRRGGKRKRGGGEGPGDSESDSDSEREERLHSAPRRSGGGGGSVIAVLRDPGGFWGGSGVCLRPSWGSGMQWGGLWPVRGSGPVWGHLGCSEWDWSLMEGV